MQLSSQDIFSGINAVRANPQTAMLKIKQQLTKFQSNTVYRNKQGVKIRTMSGKAAWQDAILSLQRQKYKNDLVWNESLGMAAEQYKDNAESKVSPFDIIKSICSYEGMISFNVNQSQVEPDISELIASMIVCDGNEQKGTRTAIFHPKYKEFGCSVAYDDKKMTVYMIFAEKVIKGGTGKKVSSQNQAQSQSKGGQQSERPIGGGGGSSSHNKPTVKEDENTRQHYLKAGRELISQLNKIRKDPKSLIMPLKEEMGKIKEDKTLTTQYGIVTTKQGKIPYEDLISELQSQYALPTMREVQGLSYTALQQILQIQAQNQNPTSADTFLNKFCSQSEGIRSIKLTNVDDMPIKAMILRLILGDGDRKRTGRKKLLSPICKALGCAISKQALVINVGESARDNTDVVDKYRQGLEHAKQESNQKPQGMQEKNNSGFSGGFPMKNQSNLQPSSTGSQKVIVKKLQKSQTKMMNGRKYKVTTITILFDDGTEQQTVQEDLVQ